MIPLQGIMYLQPQIKDGPEQTIAFEVIGIISKQIQIRIKSE